jgi:maleamate amidohydrolase
MLRFGLLQLQSDGSIPEQSRLFQQGMEIKSPADAKAFWRKNSTIFGIPNVFVNIFYIPLHWHSPKRLRCSFIFIFHSTFVSRLLCGINVSTSNSINELIKAFRKLKFPIIWVRQEFECDLSDAFLIMRKTGKRITIKGTPGAQILPELEVSSEVLEIIKKRYSAFFQTGLEALLKNLEASHLILAGVDTHACIRTAAVDGYQRDYEIILADDCINSYDAEFHRDSKRYLEGRVGTFISNAQILENISRSSISD